MCSTWSLQQCCGCSAEVWFGFLSWHSVRARQRIWSSYRPGYKNKVAQKLQGVHEFMKLLVLQSTKELLLSIIRQRTPKIAFSRREEWMILHLILQFTFYCLLYPKMKFTAKGIKKAIWPLHNLLLNFVLQKVKISL